MRPPRVLLVYANPAITTIPVPPYGAERIAQALTMSGCSVQIVAPWLELDPLAQFTEALDWGPDLVGFSIRNLDDALIVRSADAPGSGAVIDTEGYLPPIRPLVDAARDRGIPVLYGGAGFSASPEGVVAALGGGLGLRGPAEDLVWRMGRAMVGGTPFPDALPDDPRVVGRPGGADAASTAQTWRPPPGPTPRMSEFLTLARARKTAIPVQLSAGCDRRCAFCVEASFLDRKVVPRPVQDIAREIELLARAGIRRVFLIASELNVSTADHAIRSLQAIARLGLDVELRGFLQPAPLPGELIDALIDAGLDPTNLSVEFGHLDDRLLRAGAGPANLRQIEALVDLWLEKGLPTLGGAILLGAHPEEDWESVDGAIATARRLDAALPEGLGLAWATGGRVYAASPLGRWVADHPDAAAPHLYGQPSPGFAAPLVFSKPAPPRELFRHVAAGLDGMRGHCFPLNAEAPGDPVLLDAERRLNLGILRAEADRLDDAERLFRQALERAPEHREALKQLGLLLANLKGDFAGALAVFERLRAAVDDEAHLVEDVDRAICSLRGLVGAG